jgi:dinuclear metal center YbgI/SA1388 family protein
VPKLTDNTITVAELTSLLHQHLAPQALQEPYDNCGLLVGDPAHTIAGIMIALDTTEAIITEAKTHNCNVIISHHPIIFNGLKSITHKNHVERTVIKAIKNDIALIAIHTNLDNVAHGVNQKICDKIGLKNTQILAPKHNVLQKIITFVPHTHAQKLLQALFDAGAGNIGNYAQTSYAAQGTGTFMPNTNARPYTNTPANTLHHEPETKIETIFETHKTQAILHALHTHHPYETPAYDLIALQNPAPHIGAGMIGTLPKPTTEPDLIQLLKQQFGAKIVRHTQPLHKPIQTIALCGGSGSFLLKNAIAAKADAYISADFKYNDFFDADNKIFVADIGHYETEQFTPEIIKDFLTKKLRNFVPILVTNTNTNPIFYS